MSDMLHCRPYKRMAHSFRNFSSPFSATPHDVPFVIVTPSLVYMIAMSFIHRFHDLSEPVEVLIYFASLASVIGYPVVGHRMDRDR